MHVVNQYYLTQAKDSKQALKITCTLGQWENPDVRILFAYYQLIIHLQAQRNVYNMHIIIILQVLCS